MTADVLAREIASELGDGRVMTAGDALADYSHDEAYGVEPVLPAAVLFPRTSDEVVAIMEAASRMRVPVTPRGSGTGLAGACVASEGGVVLSLEKMDSIIEVDTANHVAVVQPGVTLARLDEATASHGLAYPVVIGEKSASLGGTVATNAGGMQAVKYGVTRNHVLGLEVVLADGRRIRTGGKTVKRSSGYELTQLFVGSEGTLGVVTEITARLVPRMPIRATVLAPFTSLGDASAAVPAVTLSGVGPLLVEYIDMLTMEATTRDAGVDLGVPGSVKERALAYLVVVVEGGRETTVDQDVAEVAGLLASAGAIDVYVLPSPAGQGLLAARDRAHWTAKAAGADDIVDVVVPRAAMAEYMEKVGSLATAHHAFVAGCGHAGDGNVHLSIFQPDPGARLATIHAILEAGRSLGGEVSAEHGIGKAKRHDFLDLADPVQIEIMRKIKAALDPESILSPGNVV